MWLRLESLSYESCFLTLCSTKWLKRGIIGNGVQMRLLNVLSVLLEIHKIKHLYFAIYVYSNMHRQ